MSNMLLEVEKLRTSGSMFIEISSEYDGSWFICMAQQFPDGQEVMFIDYVSDLQTGLKQGIDYIHKIRKAKNKSKLQSIDGGKTSK